MADNKADFEVELVDDVTPAAKKAKSSLERLSKALKGFNKSTIGGGIQKLASFTKAAMTVGGAVAGAIGGGIAALTVGMVDFGQRSRQAFSLLAKEGEVPEQLFQRSIALAQQLGLDIKSTTKQVQKFRALQFSQNQAEALIKMGADMQALGASGEEVSRIFSQLGQIKAKNKLQSEELVTLAESGVSTQVVFAALAKQLGKTEDQIKAMVSSGDINGAQALNAIGTAILVKTGTKQFGEAGKMMAENTLSGMAGVLKAKAQGMFLGIADSAAGDITNTAKVLFKELTGFMDSSTGKGFAKGIADAVAFLAQVVRDAIPFVKSFLSGFGEGATSAFTEVAGAFKMFLGPLTGGDGKMGLAIMKSIGQTLGALVVILGGVAVAFGALTAAMTVAFNFSARMLKGQFDVFVNTFGMIFSAVENFWDNLSAIWNAKGMSLGEKGIEIGKALVQGFVDGMTTLAFLPASTMQAIAMRTVDTAKSVFQQHSPSKVFEKVGENNVIGLNRGHEMLPSQKVIGQTLGNDNGVPWAQTRGNLSGAPSGSTRGASRAPSIGPITINVQVTPGTSPQQARAMGEAAAEGFRDRVQEFFDELLIEEAV